MPICLFRKRSFGRQESNDGNQPARVIRSVKPYDCYRPKFVAGTTH